MTSAKSERGPALSKVAFKIRAENFKSAIGDIVKEAKNLKEYAPGANIGIVLIKGTEADSFEAWRILARNPGLFSFITCEEGE